VLVHDAQFLEPERAVADLFGHATVDDALALAELAGARRLALFHHAPARADDDVEAIGRALAETAGRSGVDVFVAREEDVVDLAPTHR
jgi:ribonuclease BN (tRNA processing enzyme)